MPGIAIIAAFMAGAYLAGSIPFGWLIGKMRGVDIRQHGSKNIGATNCGRVCGWPCGATAFVLDVAKGFGPVFFADMAFPHVTGDAGKETVHWLLITLVAVMPIVGHVLPVWLGFRGGKAVATSLGVLLAMPMLWWLALAVLGVWCVVTGATAYVSVGSTVAALALVAGYLWFQRAGAWGPYLPVTVFVLALVAMVILRHRSNYARLLRGTENRIWGRKRDATGG